MEQNLDCQTIDQSESNYGSLPQTNSNNGSDSSLSISVRSSELDIDDIYSTSGCSTFSCTMHPSAQRSKKKEKVKQCLQELKSLLAPAGDDKMNAPGTLSALQLAISQMKKSKEKSNRVITMTKEIPLEISQDELTDLLKSEGVTQEPLYGLAVYDGTIMNASKDLVERLHYPKDFWIGKELSSLVHRQDIPYTTKCLYSSPASSSSHDEGIIESDYNEYKDGISGKEKVHLRMQYYKCLNQGFALKKTQYIPFTVTSYDKSKTVVYKDGTTGTHAFKVLSFSIIKSAYKVSQEKPEANTFSTRHSVFCQYNFVSSSAIPLLGYLPQEMIGTTIFDYYHPDDLHHLYNMYQKVILLGGTIPVRSEPYRLRAKNKDFIIVQSDWSSFVDPWTKKVEFLVGQHTVLRGPDDVNVFSEVEKMLPPEWNQPEVQTLITKIRKLLVSNMTLKSEKEKRTIVMSTSPSITSTEVHVEEEFAFDVVEASRQIEDEKRDDLTEQMATESPPSSSTPNAAEKVYSPDLLPTYELLNYSENIKRFLTSCPQTVISDESDEKSDSAVEKVLQDDDVSILVNLPLPGPLSYGSSTKVLVSEQEPRDDNLGLPASPGRDVEIDDLAGHEQHMSMENYRHTMLTQEVLTIHTRLQETQYLKDVIREPMSLFCPLPSKELQPNDKKRKHVDDQVEHTPMKLSKGIRYDLHALDNANKKDGGAAAGMFTTPSEPLLQQQQQQAQHYTFNFMPMNCCTPGAQAFGQPLPGCAYMTDMITPSTIGHSSSMAFVNAQPRVSGIERILSAQSQVSHMINTPVLQMGSFFQPSRCHMLPLTTCADTVEETTKVTNFNTTRMALATSSVSTDDTSSLSFLLESRSSSKINLVSHEKLMSKLPRRRYLIPLGDTSSSSNDDIIKRKPVFKLLGKQKTKSTPSATITKAREKNDAKTVDDKGMSKKSSGFGSESSVLSKAIHGGASEEVGSVNSCNTPDSSKSPTQTAKCIAPQSLLKECSSSESQVDSAVDDIAMSSSSSNSPKGKLGSGKKSKKSKQRTVADSPSNKLEVESNSSQNSSAITPSESRSTEENRSSIKESEDGSSSKGSDMDVKLSKDSNSSEPEENDATTPRDNDDNLFIPVKPAKLVRHPVLGGGNAHRLSKPAPITGPIAQRTGTRVNVTPKWLEMVNMTKKVEMEYRLEQTDEKAVLDNQQRKLNTMTQPGLLYAQLHHLLHDIHHFDDDDTKSPKSNTDDSVGNFDLSSLRTVDENIQFFGGTQELAESKSSSDSDSSSSRSSNAADDRLKFDHIIDWLYVGKPPVELTSSSSQREMINIHNRFSKMSE
ncbi:uncharacterized protein LOC141908490 isoform X2 [Tubulanus polymorphus]|uniref:uncharacterized protein LOC141908490 isoform X2 n=1 Tax=Tubulanus polymorphus TaxID=672921 RepID=UPI003DA2709D